MKNYSIYYGTLNQLHHLLRRFVILNLCKNCPTSFIVLGKHTLNCDTIPLLATF